MIIVMSDEVKIPQKSSQQLWVGLETMAVLYTAVKLLQRTFYLKEETFPTMGFISNETKK